LDRVDEKLKTLIIKVSEDTQKWSFAEWLMLEQWVKRLELHRNNILSDQTETYLIHIDLFWIKLFGLIEEFEAVIRRYHDPIANVFDIKSKLYQEVHSLNDRDEWYNSLTSIFGEQGKRLLLSYQKILSLLASVRCCYTESDLIVLRDYRSHMCHPVVENYRIMVGKNGKVKERAYGRTRSEIQAILELEHQKYREMNRKIQPEVNTAICFAKKLSAKTLGELKRELSVCSGLKNPFLKHMG
jgi:hypothetical protein